MLKSHKSICGWCANRENQHAAGTEAAGPEEKTQPVSDLIMLQVYPLQQSHSDSPPMIGLLALKKTFDI